MRRRGRTDEPHAALVDALRRVGCLVASTASVGAGFPDLVVWHHGRLHLLEVKDGTKPPSRRKLTPDQQAFIAEGWPVEVVLSVEEALAVVTRREQQRST